MWTIVVSFLKHWRTYLVLLLTVVTAVSASLAYGVWRGRQQAKQQEKIVTLEKVVEVQQKVIEVQAARNEAEKETDALPEAPEQNGRPPTVGAAPPGTPAGVLRDDGWTRD